jgi:hypothetical protein
MTSPALGCRSSGSAHGCNPSVVDRPPSAARIALRESRDAAGKTSQPVSSNELTSGADQQARRAFVGRSLIPSVTVFR